MRESSYPKIKLTLNIESRIKSQVAKEKMKKRDIASNNSQVSRDNEYVFFHPVFNDPIKILLPERFEFACMQHFVCKMSSPCDALTSSCVRNVSQ